MLKLTLNEALARLAHEESDYLELIKQRKFDLGLYQPVMVDPQTPHARDELYIIAAGTGTFVCADASRPFAPGDVFFVAAHTEHRFLEFSPDFATWVVFFGTPG